MNEALCRSKENFKDYTDTFISLLLILLTTKPSTSKKPSLRVCKPAYSEPALKPGNWEGWELGQEGHPA